MIDLNTGDTYENNLNLMEIWVSVLNEHLNEFTYLVEMAKAKIEFSSTNKSLIIKISF